MSQARKEKLSFRAWRESVWLRCNTQPPDNKFIAAHTELFALGGAARGDSDQCLENLQSHLIQVSLPRQ